MTFNAQLDELVGALRTTRARLLAPLDHHRLLLPSDAEVFVEDVLLYVMDEWAADLREQGHVLQEDTSWTMGGSDFPRYILRMAGGNTALLHFSGEYPESMFLTISKGFRDPNQFSDTKQVTCTLPITNDPNVLLLSILEALRNVSI